MSKTVAARKIGPSNTEISKSLKKPTEKKTLSRKSATKLEYKSSVKKKPLVSSSDGKIKRIPESNKRSGQKILESKKSSNLKKETKSLSKTVLRKDSLKKVEATGKISVNKFPNRNNAPIGKLIDEKIIKMSFNSFLHNGPKETKVNPIKNSTEASEMSIFKSKVQEKPSLEIETWRVGVPKPVFNVAMPKSRNLDRSGGPENSVVRSESHIKRVAKKISPEEGARIKSSARKIWRF